MAAGDRRPAIRADRKAHDVRVPFEENRAVDLDTQPAAGARLGLEVIWRIDLLGRSHQVHGSGLVRCDRGPPPGRRIGARSDLAPEVASRPGLGASALLCRYDHPATDCMVMGAEIDRRRRTRYVAEQPRLTVARSVSKMAQTVVTVDGCPCPSGTQSEGSEPMEIVPGGQRIGSGARGPDP